MMSEDKLIFIISQPRAGSTLLQALLSNNGEVDTSSEHWFMLSLASFLKPELNDGVYDSRLAVDALNDHLLKACKKGEFQKALKEFALKFYGSIQRETSNFVLDKTPRYYEFIPELREFFPNAKFIILIRDPRYVLKSIMITWDRFRFRELYRSHYRDIFHAPHALLSAKRSFKNDPNTFFVKYEDLTSEPEKQIKELYAKLGLKFTTEALNYEHNLKFRGKYGDPVGVQKSSSPVSPRDTSYGIGSRKNNDLIEGYGAYLGSEFMDEFGGYQIQNERVNRQFSMFHYYCNSRADDRFRMSEFDPKRLIKDLLLRVRYK